jgi:hypothetical protein
VEVEVALKTTRLDETVALVAGPTTEAHRSVLVPRVKEIMEAEAEAMHQIGLQAVEVAQVLRDKPPLTPSRVMAEMDFSG